MQLCIIRPQFLPAKVMTGQVFCFQQSAASQTQDFPFQVRAPILSILFFFPQNYAKNFMNFADRIYNNSRSQFMSLAMQFAIVFDAPICFDIEPFLYSTFTQLCLSQPLSLFTQSVNTKIRREQTK